MAKKKADKIEIRDRIVSRENADPRSLTANAKNWRTHSERQTNALKGVLSQVGWVQQVVVNKRTGNIIDGHLRVDLAIKNGEDSIPVGYVDLSPEEEALILATFDPISQLAGTDPDILGELLDDVSTTDAAVAGLLQDIAKDAGIVDYVTEPKKGKEPSQAEVEDLKYELVFDDIDDRAAFFEFVKKLRRMYPDADSIAGRLAEYIRENVL